MSIDAHGYPIAFRTGPGGARPGLLSGNPGEAVLAVEVRQVSHHAKEAVVCEGEGGFAWRLASDEGVHLKGTDLAPFPLGYFNAGLQADLAGSIVRLARARGIAIDRLGMTLTTAYSLTGSFVQGTGVGEAEGVFIDLDLQSKASGRELGQLVEAAVHDSPALAMIRSPIENTFALYVNGRRRNPTTLPASRGGDAVDPFLKYASAPTPAGSAAGWADLVVKTGEKQPGEPIMAPISGKVIREVKGRGEMTDADGRYSCTAALNLPGSSVFAFTSDETSGGTAPSGLSLAAAGIAFCYITQIWRYIENMKLPIRNVRLVQLSPFARDRDGQGTAAPCDTHLFLNGETDDDTFEMLQRVAANTCYLHRTMLQTPPLRIEVKQAGKSVYSNT